MSLTPEQFAQLLQVLKAIAEKQQYSLTGASDWPMLVFLVGIILAMIGLMWRDLGSRISRDISEVKTEQRNIWSAMKDCQDDCCPRGKK